MKVPGIDGMPQPAFRSKPDPDEPWRYVCPNCHGNVSQRNSGQRFRCKNCNEMIPKKELHDKKTGEKVMW